MIERLNSLRVWLLLAMLATAVVTILVGNLVVDRVNSHAEIKADRAKALVTARAIAADVREQDSREDLRVLQRALPNDQIIVTRHGRRIFTGPPRTDLPLEMSVAVSSHGTTVVFRDHHAPDSIGLGQLSLMAGGLAALIIAEAWLGATVLTRTVRQPLRRAIETTDRLAAGDFSARMRVSGPEELSRMGRAFDRMAAQLERADAEQRRFLADLTHEIATPVSAVSGFAMALVDGTVQTDGERADAAGVVRRESRRLDRLLESVRNLHRLDLFENGQPELVELDVICAEVARRFRLAAGSRGVSLDVHAEPVKALADPRLVETVLDNLMSNALRHTPRGGNVTLSVRRRPGSAVIALRDTGGGIAPEHLERIFDRLYRVDDARDHETGGSGLGLAIARRAAQAMGGRIEVETTPGTGSEFRLCLALSTDEASDAKLPQPRTRPTQIRR